MLNCYFYIKQTSYFMKHLFTLSFLLFSFFSFGQQTKVDSLSKLLTKVSSTKEQIIIHQKICELSYVNNPKKGVHSANEILRLSKENPNFKNHFFARRYLGIYFMNKTKFDKAKTYFRDNLKEYNFNEDYRQAYTDLTNMGNVFRYQKEKDSALNYLTKAMNLVEKKKIKDKYTTIYNGIAAFYYYNNDVDTAIKYYIKAIDSSKYLKSKSKLISVYNNIGTIFKDLDNYNKAVNYLTKGYELAKNMNHQQGVADASLNLANCYFYLGKNHDSIKPLFEKSIKIYKELNDNIFLQVAHENYGNYLSEKKHFNKAIQHKKQGLYLAQKANMEDKVFSGRISLAKSLYNTNNSLAALKLVNIALKDTINNKINSFENLQDVYLLKSKIEKKLGNLRAALKFQEKYSKIIISHHKTVNKSSINELETKYQTEKKEKENLQLKQEKAEQQLLLEKENQQKWLLGIGLLASLLTLGVFVYYYRKNQQQKQLIESLQKELHHRVKNNLTIINRFVEVIKDEFNNPIFNKKLTELQNRISSINEVHKQLYNSKNVIALGMNAYVNKLTKNVADSFPKQSIKIDKNINENLQLTSTKSFPLGIIINEFVTNSYKYAFNENGGTINITMQENKKHYELQLADNGKGLPTNFNQQTDVNFGLRIIKLLCNQIDATFNLESNNGVQLTIQIPK